MKKTRMIFMCVTFCLLIGFSQTTSAVTLVDTGPGPLLSDPGNNWGINSGTWFAGQFILDQAAVLTDIEGWMAIGPMGFDFDIRLYNNNGVLPGSSLFSAEVILPSPSTDYLEGWYGLHGVAVSLLPGTYWVSFEGTNSEQSSSIMPGPASLPLGYYATKKWETGPGEFGPWQPADYLKVGVRIQGNVVPEPASILLIGSGLMGLIGFKRKNK